MKNITPQVEAIRIVGIIKDAFNIKNHYVGDSTYRYEFYYSISDIKGGSFFNVIIYQNLLDGDIYSDTEPKLAFDEDITKEDFYKLVNLAREYDFKFELTAQ